MTGAVLDSSALLALVNGESGGDMVAAYLPGATISMVNFAEVVGKLAEAGAPENEIRQKLLVLGLNLVATEEEDACQAGFLRPSTRHLGLSLSDRFCLALGKRTNALVLTSDKAWADVPDVNVRVIR